VNNGLRGLKKIDTWVFDLDNTLYPASKPVFSQIDKKMQSFIAARLSITRANALKLQKKYYKQYGTTLFGLMKNHNVNAEEFLEYVHDIDYSVLNRENELKNAIDTLQGRKIIYTNGSHEHATNTLKALGINDCFHSIYDITASDYMPKPRNAAFKSFIKKYNITPNHTLMFEDSLKNLETAHKLGIMTALIRNNDNMTLITDEPKCHFIIDNLTNWLIKVEKNLYN